MLSPWRRGLRTQSRKWSWGERRQWPKFQRPLPLASLLFPVGILKLGACFLLFLNPVSETVGPLKTRINNFGDHAFAQIVERGSTGKTVPIGTGQFGAD